MNKMIRSLVALTAFGAAAFVAQAQPAPKVYVVDLAKLFNGHYKTEEQLVKFNEDQKKAQEEFDRLNKEYNGLVEKYKEFDEQTKNPALTNEAKAKAQSDGQHVVEDIRRKQMEMQTFQQQTRESFQTRSQNFRAIIFDEISKIASTVAQRHGATLLIDKSGPSFFGVPSLIYSDASYDITDEVMKEINKDRPAPAAAAPAASSSTPAPAASTPDSSDSPKITLPGVAPKK